MTLAALTYCITGAVASFAPEVVTSFLKTENSLLIFLLVQAFGAFNFAMGIQNWMLKSSLIGGIYNRPLVIANLIYFMMSGIAISKGLMKLEKVSVIICFLGIIYLLFAIVYCFIFFKNPSLDK